MIEKHYDVHLPFFLLLHQSRVKKLYILPCSEDIPVANSDKIKGTLNIYSILSMCTLLLSTWTCDDHDTLGGDHVIVAVARATAR